MKIHKGSERIFEIEKVNDLKNLKIRKKKLYSERVAFKFKTDKPGEFRTKTYAEYIEEINALGTAMMSIGLQGKKIAVISENRYEWTLTYFATVNGTGVIVPLDRSLPELEIINLVEASGAEAIFYSNKYSEVMDKIRQEKIGKIQYFISMEAEESTQEVYSQKELIRIGKDLMKNGSKIFTDATIDNEEMAIMLFTSGTTSKSKAVSLSHKNICTNLYDIASVFDVNKEDTILSFLPLHHTYECTVGFLYPVYVGATITYCEGIRHIADNIKEYQASVMISVPVLFESLYKRVMQNIEKKGMTKKVQMGLKISNFLRKIGIDKRRQIFKEIHENLGGKLRLFVAGAAAFDPKMEKGLNDLGIDTYQGYGLTETSPVISAEHLKAVKYGSVGKVFPSLEVSIFEPNEEGIGEIIVRGDTIMKGYVNQEEATKEVIVDGWFHTGDLGYFDKNEFLYITGRKKNVIVLKNGKNIYPEEIEAMINDIVGVKESFVFGRPDKKDKEDLKLATKVVYDEEVMKEQFGLEDEKEIHANIWKEIKEINKKMPTYKYVKELLITKEEFIKTTTQKIKRFEELKKIDETL